MELGAISDARHLNVKYGGILHNLARDAVIMFCRRSRDAREAAQVRGEDSTR